MQRLTNCEKQSNRYSCCKVRWMFSDLLYVICLRIRRSTPFMRYQPHRCSPSVVAADADEGIHDVPSTSPLFIYLESTCATAGCLHHGVANMIAGYRLSSVQAGTDTDGRYLGYEDELRRWCNNRKTGMQFFNCVIRELEKSQSQLHVLDALRSHFQERPPGTDARSANTFYSFHDRLFKDAVCFAVLVHLEIFHLCFSFCNIIENVVWKNSRSHASCLGAVMSEKITDGCVHITVLCV
jgi:hypothetical protein